LSALSLMCRTAILLIALALLTTAGASGAQASAAKAHRRTPVRAGVHGKRRPAAPFSVRRDAHPRAMAVARHKPTPEEAGRVAGLAIRKLLQEKRAARETAAARKEHATHRKEAKKDGSPKDIQSLRHRETEATSPPSAKRLPSRVEEQAREDAMSRPNVDRTARITEKQASALAVASAKPRDHEGFANDSIAGQVRSVDAETATPEEDGPEPVRGGAMKLRGSEAAAKTQGAESLLNVAEPDDAEGPARPARDATLNAETEEASLRVPRGGMPRPLYGSLASLERQNARLEAEGLERIEDEDDLQARIANRFLVPLPASGALSVNPNLPEDHRYCRPWTAKFLADLARAHNALFHKPLKVNSAVRTVEYQKRLMEINGNAAPAQGDIVSPHLTGATVDIGKDGMSRAEIAWMRQRLMALQNADKIDVEEEFQQACFHITVYKTYAPPRQKRRVTPAVSAKARTKHKPARDLNTQAASDAL
jgi:Family of unknown function (DUF5715)